MGFFDGFIKTGIKTAKQTLKNEVERIYNLIDENDEKIAQNVKDEIEKIPVNVNYFNTPVSFHDEIEGLFKLIANVAYFSIDKTDDVAGLLKSIFDSILGV